MKKGRFIVIDGGEGSGKGRVIRLLRRRLARLGDQVIFTREPGADTKVGRAIRHILLSPRYTGITSLTELLLFLADRAQHLDEVVRPALAHGKLVISDRFSGSTVAYQIFGAQKKGLLTTCEVCNSLVVQDTKPDLTICLDVPPEVGLARRKGALGRPSRIDEQSLVYHRRVRQGFLYQAKKDPSWKVIDANRPFEQVKEDVWGLVKPLIPKRG